MKKIYSFIFVCLLCLSAWAQELEFKARLVDTRNQALKGAMVVSPSAESAAISDENGRVQLRLKDAYALISISCDGYYSQELPFYSQGQGKEKLIVMIPENWEKYSAQAATLNKKDMRQAMNIDDALKGNISGLQVVGKSGMPGEGAYLNTGGIHSIKAENMPLIVLNGVPYLMDNEISTAINGYSRSLFTSLNIDDIKSISLLEGAEAARYGSLGSNGVLLIETEQATSDNLDTRISFSGQYGAKMAGRTVESLDADQYKNYLRQVGMTRYERMGQLLSDYPFLQTDASYPTAYIFNNNTRWQDEIYQRAMLTNNVFRVEGGDEIAKYNMSVGYSSDGGTIKGTKNDRYHTLINSNVMVSRKVEISTSVALAYMRSQLQEQGMSQETNPMLAAWSNMPVLNPYYAGTDGNLTSRYATYDFANVNATPTYAYENVSNPAAIVNTLEADDKIYDVNVLLGLKVQATEHLGLHATYNRQYRYIEENLFIPGVDNQAIYPQYYGIGSNTVRMAVAESRNNYFDLRANYRNTFDRIHQVTANAGARIMTTSHEYDLSTGYNTANDYYSTLDKTTDEQYTSGYINSWVWANYYLQGQYTWKQLLALDLTATIDGSSVSGLSAPLYYFYPAAKLSYLLGNHSFMPSWVNDLRLSAEFAKSGNSRFSSNYAKNYYTGANFFDFGAIIRHDIPNTLLEPEKQNQSRIGLQASLFKQRLQVEASGYNTYAYDLLIPQDISSVYASGNYYANVAAIASQGYTASLRAAIVESKAVSWTLGGNISFNKSLVKDLGEQDELSITYSDYSDNEDAVVKLKVGEAPYQFYGYRTDGVYSTSAEAAAADLTSVYNTKYQAGDVRFVDTNNDKVINEQDKVLLGSSRPDFFGSVFSSLRVGQLSLSAQINYSIGGKIYNAVRRQMESMENFHNQSTAVLNRWQVEGQQTSMPRAAYGDPNGNNIFSDRWLEDASYAKLGRLTLNYAINLPNANFIHSGNVWISGENLFTWSNYLGNDPELAYSYDDFLYGIDYAKVPNPRTIKIGFNLNF